MIFLDANSILRYLTLDVEAQAEEVNQLIQDNACFVLDEVLAEVTYVLLGKYYRFSRVEIAEALKAFVDTDNIVVSSQSALEKALEVYEKTDLDFVDCILAGYGIADREEIFTFDKQLKKLINSEIQKN
jgi:predicted nucleic-acid-binding protein